MPIRTLLLALFSLILLAPNGLRAQESEFTIGEANAAHWNTDTVRIYRYFIEDMIDPTAWIGTQYAIKNARERNADVLLVEMNT